MVAQLAQRHQPGENLQKKDKPTLSVPSCEEERERRGERGGEREERRERRREREEEENE